MRCSATVLAALLLAGGGRKAPPKAVTPGAEAEPKAAEPNQKGELSSTAARERDGQIRNSLAKMAREEFPDNAHNTWEIRAIEHEDDMSYVRAVPSSDDVGYPSFIFALHFRKDKDGRCVAVYAMEGGKHTLLSSVMDFDGPLPKARQ